MSFGLISLVSRSAFHSVRSAVLVSGQKLLRNRSGQRLAVLKVTVVTW